MIVEMKKLTLLCTSASQESTLNELRDLGVVHLQHVKVPEGEGLEEAKSKFGYIKTALDALNKDLSVSPSGKPANEVVDGILNLINRKQELSEKVKTLEVERKRYEAFGAFSVGDIIALKNRGIDVKLLSAPLRQLPEQPEDANLVELSRDKTSAYFALISREPVEMVEVEEFPLPECSAEEMSNEIDSLNSQLADVENKLNEYAGDYEAVAAIAEQAEENVNWLEARSGMGEEENVSYLRGFFPAEREENLRSVAKKNGWATLIDTPTEEDHVPTLLKNPKWTNPIKPVLKMIGVLPGYNEIDISALFLLFLSIFFAFLIGDAGYGLLFIAITLFAKFKLSTNKEAQPALNLLLIMSSFTVIWGVLNGTYFGIEFDCLPAPLRKISSPWLIAGGDEDLSRNRVMLICFTIGAVHLTIAHAWGFIRKLKTPACLCDLGWLCSTWALYVVVLNLVLSMVDLSPVVWVILCIGVVLVATGLILSKEMSGLITLALDVISNFVDIISYVRLYAVGAASLAIAQSFNQMGLDAGNAMPPVIGALIAALIIFFGHALNIVLGAMSVLVHGIRLNTLEFSGHAGIQWSGVAYNPFSKKSK